MVRENERKADLDFSPLGAAGPSRPLLPGPLGGLGRRPAGATFRKEQNLGSIPFPAAMLMHYHQSVVGRKDEEQDDENEDEDDHNEEKYDEAKNKDSC